ncbi:MAG: hypothetical protein KQH57_18060 [Actinomycetales bacterium]|nr:hypothetical protein [Actinomycetales bacterium]
MRIRIAAGSAAAAFLLAALTGCGAGPAAPTTDTPAPTPTATTSTPSTSAPPTPEALSTPTVDPLLPTAEPLTRGLLATTDAGWLIVKVSPTSDRQSYDRTVTATYLIDPTGVRYQLPDLPSGDLYLFEWLPGTALALASSTTGSGTSVVVVDLETGATTPVDLGGIAADAGLVNVDVLVTFVGDGTTDLLVSMSRGGTGLGQRRTLDGQVTASTDEPTILVPTPGGRVLLNATTGAPQWVDPDTLTVRAPVQLPDTTCWVSKWLDLTGSVLATCPGSGWYVASPDAATWQLPVEPSVTWGVTPLVAYPDGTVLVRSGDVSGPADTVRMSATTAAPVKVPVTLGRWVHGTVVAGIADGDQTGADALVAWDSADGTTNVLVPGLAAPAGQTLSVVDSPDRPNSQGFVIDLGGALTLAMGS